MDRFADGRFPQGAMDALRGITRPELRGAMLFGLVACAFSMLIYLTPIAQLIQTLPWHLVLIGGVLEFQIKALVLLAAIVIANRAVDAGAGRRKAYVAAAIGGCLAGLVISETFAWAWRAFVLPDRWPEHRPYTRGTASLLYFPIFSATNWLLLGAPAVFLYADRRAARKTAAYLHSAELDRLSRSKLALESRLQAMQARVEPQFLFNTLAQVERLYEQDPSMAGRMLDDLIAYLRAAMPLMRDTSSTVAQEVELARRYLDIVKIRLGNRLTYDIRVPPGLEDARMPPMMLLPLVDHAIVHGLERSRADGTLGIAIDAAEDRLRLRIVDSGAGFVPETGGDGIGSIRDRLAALYGSDARLELTTHATGNTEALMDIPCEFASGRAAA
jgi:hypothetical protein